MPLLSRNRNVPAVSTSVSHGNRRRRHVIGKGMAIDEVGKGMATDDVFMAFDNCMTVAAPMSQAATSVPATGGVRSRVDR